SFSNPFLSQRSRDVNCIADSLIGAATTKVSTHGFSDIGVSWFRILSEQACCRHHLSRLAVTTLRNLDLHPRLLHRMTKIFGETFNRSHLFTFDSRHGRDAGTNGITVHMYGAAPADRHSAAVLCTG